jgi:hypothetical protein
MACVNKKVIKSTGKVIPREKVAKSALDELRAKQYSNTGSLTKEQLIAKYSKPAYSESSYDERILNLLELMVEKQTQHEKDIYVVCSAINTQAETIEKLNETIGGLARTITNLEQRAVGKVDIFKPVKRTHDDDDVVIEKAEKPKRVRKSRAGMNGKTWASNHIDEAISSTITNSDQALEKLKADMMNAMSAPDMTYDRMVASVANMQQIIDSLELYTEQDIMHMTDSHAATTSFTIPRLTAEQQEANDAVNQILMPSPLNQ